jgi:glucokinase
MLISVVDVGGSHLSHAVYDPSSRALLPGTIGRVALTGHAAVSPLHGIRSIATNASAALGDALGGVALAIPNPFDHVAGVSRMRHKLSDLFGVDLRQLLSAATRLAPDVFVFLNDADAFLLGALAGETERCTRAIGITLGTGIGSAFALNGEIVTGGAGVPAGGEIWDTPFGSGMVEDAISTRALVSDYLQSAGKRIDVTSIGAAARQGDVQAQEAFTRFARQLAAVLNQLCQDFPADKILLGGGICGEKELFLPTTREALVGWRTVDVASNRHEAPLIGAGIAWQRARLAKAENGARSG